jgi:ABC-type transporter Mla subunit MlaD
VNGVVGPAGPDIRGTAANLNAVTGSLKEKLPSMIDKVNQTIDSARTALEEVNQTVVNAKEISASVKTVIAGNRGKLESVIASVKTTADNLKAASTEIRHSPWRLLYQPKTEELSNLNLFDAAREFADGANELNDASQALRDAMKDKNTDPQQMQQLINRLEKTFANFHDVEQKLWKDVKE